MPGGGGLLQLISQGPSSAYLTDKPDITFFKALYKRHSVFSVESYLQSFLGDVNFGKRSTVQLARTGDLCGPCFLEVKLPDLTSFVFDSPDTSTIPRQPRIIKSFFQSPTTVSFTVDTSNLYSPTNAILGSVLVVDYKSSSTPNRSCALNITPLTEVVAKSGSVTYVDTTGLAITDYKAIDKFEMRTFVSGSYVAPYIVAPGISGTYADASLKRLAVGVSPSLGGWDGTEFFEVVFYTTTSGVPVELIRMNSNSTSTTTATNGTKWFQCDVPSVTSGTTFSVEIISATRTSAANIDGVLSNPRTTYNIKWADAIGFVLIKSMELDIGGARIDFYDRTWQDIWSELFLSIDKKPGIYKMVGKMTNVATGTEDYDIWDWSKSFNDSRTVFIPILFFNRNIGQSFSLASLSFHEVRFNIEWATFAECIKSNSTITSLNPSPLPQFDARFFSDIVYVDSPERNLFATKSHEYLVTVMQSNMGTPVVAALSSGQARKFDLTFTNNVKELIWVFVSDTNLETNPVTGNNHFNYNISSGDEIFTNAKILLNGNDRALERSSAFYRLLMPFQYHSYAAQKNIFLYSFALHPEDQTQPSGHLNASRISSLQLHLTLSPSVPDGKLYVFAPTWNILRYTNGMAGLLFTRTG